MERSVLLDTIRVIAIAMVIIAHIGQLMDHPIGDFFGPEALYCVSIGGVAVTMFLILSGLVLALQYRGRSFDYGEFLVKRILRIYPVYYLSVFVGLAARLLKSYGEHGSIQPVLSDLGFGDLVLSVTGGYAFAGAWGGPFVGTSWFIGLIMAMYCMYPVLARAIRKRPHTAMVSLLMLSVASRLAAGYYGTYESRPQDWHPLCRVFEFALGIYLAGVLRADTWALANGLNGRVSRGIRFLSDISFPLFLVHYPLRPVITALLDRGTGAMTAIAVYLAISLGFSYVLWLGDRRIPRRWIVQKVMGARMPTPVASDA